MSRFQPLQQSVSRLSWWLLHQELQCDDTEHISRLEAWRFGAFQEFWFKPWKINMEPENTPLESEENHLNQTIIFSFYKKIFGGVEKYWCNVMHIAGPMVCYTRTCPNSQCGMKDEGICRVCLWAGLKLGQPVLCSTNLWSDVPWVFFSGCMLRMQEENKSLQDIIYFMLGVPLSCCHCPSLVSFGFRLLTAPEAGDLLRMPYLPYLRIQ